MSATAAATVPELLGLRRQPGRPASALGLMSDVEKGLPLSALDRIAHAVAPDDSGFPYRLVPRATLARRRNQHAARLTPEESARVARLASVWAFAKDVWKTDEAARRWLFAPHLMLDDRPPIDVVLASEFGRPLVEGILGRLKYGTGA
ncbi:MAG: antitoxin Xre/MbcA/ParS toxin-binding domain-containing protein [Acetobacteraceae bacterium]